MGKRLKLISKLLSKSPNNSFLRGRLIKTRKEYNKLIRYKKVTWKNNLLKQLEKMQTTNSKEYWELIGKIKGGKIKQNRIPDPDKFEMFFKNYTEKIHMI